MDDKKKDCEHKFSPLGFDVYRKTDSSVEAVAAIFCSVCGLFRTKILTFRRELTHENNNSGTSSK